ncbi:DUF3693 domain-containing protein [Xanthomonas euvesicatoria]|uniref:DUF3693 domain-containing protein n=1 Tax=Xanthomonas euvesicatoria TaxID=456327 RepID=UPI000F8D793C|nr:DUF3693 domain-containing protein [Xanthomonas euvesicatoria]
MKATNDLLDKVREICSVSSDNALSKELGITRAVISAWRKELYPIPDQRIAELCEMAKLDGAMWVAAIHAERAVDKAEKAMWKSALDRLSAAAAVVALLVLAVHTGAHEALLTALSPLALTAPS